MRMNEKMLNRQLGRNAQEFAQAIGRMETPAVRYPYLRELLAVIEEARPEWAEAAHKADLFTHLIRDLSAADIAVDEIHTALRARDAERTLAAERFEYAPRPPADRAPSAPAPAPPRPPAPAPAAEAPLAAPEPMPDVVEASAPEPAVLELPATPQASAPDPERPADEPTLFDAAPAGDGSPDVEATPQASVDAEAVTVEDALPTPEPPEASPAAEAPTKPKAKPRRTKRAPAPVYEPEGAHGLPSEGVAGPADSPSAEGETGAGSVAGAPGEEEVGVPSPS